MTNALSPSMPRLLAALALLLVFGLASRPALAEPPHSKGESVKRQQADNDDADDKDDGKKRPDKDATPRPIRALRADLDRILSAKAVGKALVGVHVIDLATGESLYEKGADRPLNPASNIKLVTTAAVLDHFGPDFTYTTELWAASPKDRAIEGDLVLTGNGDPFLLWGHLLEMAERVRRKGVREVTGDLVVDDTAFDDQMLPPAFEQKNEDATYRATVSALAANFSYVTVIIRPGEVGKKPEVSFDPPGDYAIVENNATTVKDAKEAKGNALRLESVPDGDRTRFVLAGKTFPGGGATVNKRIHNPSLFTGYLMKEALDTVGVKVKGKVRRSSKPSGLTVLARHNSYTLPYLVAAMQKWSNNFMAEMLFKSLDLGDDPATFAGAADKVLAFLDKAGVDKKGLKITNGSGLYDANALSPRQFTSILRYMQARPDLLPEFEASFAIAGVDGTLARRMKHTPAEGALRAKTGTLNGVSTLTGFVQTKSGRHLAYSILFNNGPGGAWPYRKMQDEIGARLVVVE